MNRYVIYEDDATGMVKIISRTEYYQIYKQCRFIDSVNTYAKAKRILQKVIKINAENFMVIRSAISESRLNKEGVCSHIISFYSRTRALGKETTDRIHERYNIENLNISKYVKDRVNAYKVSFEAHEEDVCDILEMLSSEKKPSFVHSIDSAKQFTQESKLLRKRFYRDFKYLCEKKLEDGDLTPDELFKKIKDGTIFQDIIIAHTYFGLSQRIDSNNIRRMAESILAKAINKVKV